MQGRNEGLSQGLSAEVTVRSSKFGSVDSLFTVPSTVSQYVINSI